MLITALHNQTYGFKPNFPEMRSCGWKEHDSTILKIIGALLLNRGFGHETWRPRADTESRNISIDIYSARTSMYQVTHSMIAIASESFKSETLSCVKYRRISKV